MYKFLFTSALKEELNLVKESIKNLKSNTKIDFLVSEIWNYKTIFNLTKNLSENKYDFVVNIWICWFVKEMEPFQVARILNIVSNKELILPIHFKFLKLESISCSDKIIYEEKELNNEKYVDMESYWFEFVSDKFKVPRIIIKIPFDKIWSSETKSYDKNKLEKLMKQVDYEALIKEIIWFLDKYKQEDVDFNKYYSHYKFTFSEKLIFEKLYYKYISLIWNDFNCFFEKNKDLDKKEFLKIEIWRY